MQNLRCVRDLLLTFLFTAFLLFAQADRGVITGLVTDAQGAAVASATVQIKDTNTGVVTTVRTSSNDNYSTPPLVIGTYEVSVSLQGFKAFHASGISLASGQSFRQDMSLQLGDVQQQVQVSAEAQQINADNPQISASVNQRYYESLPPVMAGEKRVPEAQLYTFHLRRTKPRQHLSQQRLWGPHKRWPAQRL